jgi:hypothetical protein
LPSHAVATPKPSVRSTSLSASRTSGLSSTTRTGSDCECLSRVPEIEEGVEGFIGSPSPTRVPAKCARSMSADQSKTHGPCPTRARQPVESGQFHGPTRLLAWTRDRMPSGMHRVMCMRFPLFPRQERKVFRRESGRFLRTLGSSSYGVRSVVGSVLEARFPE